MSYVDLETEDRLQYTFFPNRTGLCQFRVRAAHDAHIALSPSAAETTPMYEIFIGGWKNTKSVIRKNRTKPDVAEVPTPGILTDKDFRGFWVRWENGTISAGNEGESSPFVSFTDNERVPIEYVGFCTGWGARGSWVIEKREGGVPIAPATSTEGTQTAAKVVQDLETEDRLQYTFFPNRTGLCQFRVRAAHDAHIALSPSAAETTPMYEIFIGGWKNTKSVIRKNRTKPDVAEVPTPGILTDKDFRGFWVRWENGTISAGNEGESSPFVSFTDNERVPIEYVGFCTGWGARGSWVIEMREGGGSIAPAASTQGTPTAAKVVKGGVPIAPAASTQGAPTAAKVVQGGGPIAPAASTKGTPTAAKVVQGGGSIAPAASTQGTPTAAKVVQGGGPIAPAASTKGTPTAAKVVQGGGSIAPAASTQGTPTAAKVVQGGGSIAPAASTQGTPTAAKVVKGPANVCWVASRNGQVPARPFVGGQDKGETIYVCRSNFNGDLTPGKLVPSHGCGFISWGGKEHPIKEYEVLCDFGGTWVATSGGKIPSGSLAAGQSEKGEPLYVGRVLHDGVFSVGKVQPSHGCLFIPYGGKELSFTNYEILVQGPANVCWVPYRNGQAPARPFVGGQDKGETLYVCRSNFNGGLVPGKLVRSHGCGFISWGGKEHPIKEYEVLCDFAGTWVATSGGKIPSGSLAAGQSEKGETLYVGRVLHNGALTVGKVHPSHGCLFIPYGGKELSFKDYQILVQGLANVCWVASQNGQVPARPFVGGEDKGETLYVCRSIFNGDLTPGKLVPSHGCGFICWGGQEHPIKEYEVLCNFGGTWVATSGGKIPSGSLAAGQSEKGELLYVGRVVHDGALTVGKVHPTYGCLFIPYGGKELSFKDYEILVQ